MASQYELNDDRSLEPDDDLAVDDNDNEVSAADDNHKSRVSDDFNIASRERLREELSAQIDAYLARGGKINQIPNRVNNTRPGKPASEYSGRLI